MNITSYVKDINEQKLRVNSVIVLQKGEKTAEHHWKEDQARNIFSVSKSFIAIALGIILDEGKMSLKDRVIEFFPESISAANNPYLESLTLEHLLTMSRGHNEFTRPLTVSEALSHKLVYEPGKVFVYDNACTFLISAMITKATGLKARDLLAEKLFTPLSIPDPLWRESDDGFTIGATGLELSAESLSVFGQFLLQSGNWNGKQIVSSKWIDGASRTHISTLNPHTKIIPPPDYNIGYGYQFWTCRHGAYRADGKDGQFLIVLPQKESVIAITSNEENMKPILYAVWDHILPQL